MTHTPVPRAHVADLWEDTDFNLYLRDNFNDCPPGCYTAKGQLYAATGAGQGGVVPAAGADGMAMVADSGQATGLAWAGGTVRIGMIIAWSGAIGSIPSGWQICDGTGGTPDLRGRFIVGAGGSYVPGDTGGGAINITHTHTPTAAATGSDGAHTHLVSSNYTGGSHAHNDSGTTGAPSATAGLAGAFGIASPTHTHNWSGNSSNTTHTHSPSSPSGSGGAHTHNTQDLAASPVTSFLPPYYALAFIMRVS